MTILSLEKGVRASLVYAPYGHNPLKHWPTARSKIDHKQLNPCLVGPRLKIYPHGFSMTKERFADNEQPEHLKDVERGQIKRFTNKAASRLREVMLTSYKANYDPYAVTLTTRNIYNPAEWRSIIKRFRTYLARDLVDWPAIWRVELQRRKTPHLHCLFWCPQALPPEVINDVLTSIWLKACREQDDPHSKLHSVKVVFLTGPEWLRYCSCHNTKHKQEQLGWEGKQWGIWNGKALEKRKPITEGEFTRQQRIVFCRRLRHLTRRRYHRKDATLSRPLKCFADRNLPAFVLESHTTAQLLRGIVPD